MICDNTNDTKTVHTNDQHNKLYILLEEEDIINN